MSDDRLEELLRALPAPPARWVETAVEIPRFADPIEGFGVEDVEDDLEHLAELPEPSWSNLEPPDASLDGTEDDYSADNPSEDPLT